MHKKFFRTLVSIISLALVGGGVTTSWAMYSDDIAHGVAKGIKMAADERESEKRRLIEKEDRERQKAEWEKTEEGLAYAKKIEKGKIDFRDKLEASYEKEKVQAAAEMVKLRKAGLEKSFREWCEISAARRNRMPRETNYGWMSSNGRIPEFTDFTASYYASSWRMKIWLDYNPLQRFLALYVCPCCFSLD